jgi:hypothetical protein
VEEDDFNYKQLLRQPNCVNFLWFFVSRCVSAVYFNDLNLDTATRMILFKKQLSSGTYFRQFYCNFMKFPQKSSLVPIVSNMSHFGPNSHFLTTCTALVFLTKRWFFKNNTDKIASSWVQWNIMLMTLFFVLKIFC